VEGLLILFEEIDWFVLLSQSLLIENWLLWLRWDFDEELEDELDELEDELEVEGVRRLI
jgi:hypothetical protein